jgi:uncharacterized membrane protein
MVKIFSCFEYTAYWQYSFFKCDSPSVMVTWITIIVRLFGIWCWFFFVFLAMMMMMCLFVCYYCVISIIIIVVALTVISFEWMKSNESRGDVENDGQTSTWKVERPADQKTSTQENSHSQKT